VRRAFGFVHDDVLKATNNRQEPFVYGSLGGDAPTYFPHRAKLLNQPDANLTSTAAVQLLPAAAFC
jgi:hypothetical protein